MLLHLCKLIWNKKKQNFLLLTEILVSFLVLFAVFTMLVYFYRNYKQPMGFEYENVWAVNFARPEGIKSKDSLARYFESIMSQARSNQQIKHASLVASNYPFSSSTNNNNVSYNKQSTNAYFYTVSDDYANGLDLKMLEGRWFNKTDNVYKDRPVVINQRLKETLFKNESPIGKIMGESPNAMKVVGVVNDFKDKGDYQGVTAGTFNRVDSTNYEFMSTLLVTVQPNADAAFEAKLFKTLSDATGSSIEIVHLANERDRINNVTLIPIIVLVIVAGFLIVNVALGLFGVLWYNINLRKNEIGLRRAVGASGNAISKQLVGEALMLATFALIVGSFFAIQFPLLSVFDLPAGIYIAALLLSITFIYLLVIVCAFYPGKQAAGIYPAVALHED